VGLDVTQHGGDGGGEPEPDFAAFYFDFSSPEAYLAAERVIQTLPFPAEWIPIRAPSPRPFAHAEIERVAAERVLQGLRWPPAGFDSELALRAATYAKQIGRVVAFGLAAFRQAYAGGADLSDTDVVLIAASACEMHPRAVLQALSREAIARELTDATALAVARGVVAVPTVWIPDGTLLEGDAALDTVAIP
jgi:2-hydroxychromene-2-carboxylate isomerase